MKGVPSPRPSPASGRGGKIGSGPLSRLRERVRVRVRVAATLLIFSTAACEGTNHRDIGDEINILIRRNDQLVAPATERLAKYRRAAIPQIETAMHTSAPSGRLHLIAALDKIGDGEAVPVLRHIADFDITA